MGVVRKRTDGMEVNAQPSTSMGALSVEHPTPPAHAVSRKEHRPIKHFVTKHNLSTTFLLDDTCTPAAKETASTVSDDHLVQQNSSHIPSASPRTTTAALLATMNQQAITLSDDETPIDPDFLQKVLQGPTSAWAVLNGDLSLPHNNCLVQLPQLPEETNTCIRVRCKTCWRRAPGNIYDAMGRTCKLNQVSDVTSHCASQDHFQAHLQFNPVSVKLMKSRVLEDVATLRVKLSDYTERVAGGKQGHSMRKAPTCTAEVLDQLQSSVCAPELTDVDVMKLLYTQAFEYGMGSRASTRIKGFKKRFTPKASSGPAECLRLLLAAPSSTEIEQAQPGGRTAQQELPEVPVSPLTNTESSQHEQHEARLSTGPLQQQHEQQHEAMLSTEPLQQTMSRVQQAKQQQAMLST